MLTKFIFFFLLSFHIRTHTVHAQLPHPYHQVSFFVDIFCARIDFALFNNTAHAICAASSH